MEDKLEKIFRKGREIRLDPSEKGKMRDFIVSYAKRNKKSQKFHIFSFSGSIPAILSFLVIFGGAGISFAAEKALPGDILYPVKIGVNEEVRGLLAVSDENKVKWLTKVAERRMEETETLAKENRLDQKAQEKIERSFDENTKKIQEKLKVIGDKNNANTAEDVSNNIENTLDRHEKILQKLSEDKSESRKEIDSVLENVKSFRDSIRNSREGSERKRKGREDNNDENKIAPD